MDPMASQIVVAFRERWLWDGDPGAFSFTPSHTYSRFGHLSPNLNPEWVDR